MKKGLTMLVAAMVVFGLICVIGSAAADDLIIGRDLTLEGKGVIFAELRVNTELCPAGVVLSEDISTPGGGFNGISVTEYSSSFEASIYNISDNSTSDVAYSSTAEAYNSKRRVYVSNNVLGTMMGFKSSGDIEQEVEMYTDYSSMSAEVEGKVLGKLRLVQKVVDVDNKRFTIVSDVIDVDGGYKYDWSAYAERPVHPAAEDGVIGWLGCP